LTSIVVPACEGRAVHVPRGKRIRVTTPKGAQAADFFAYNAASIAEWLSPPHTWVTTFNVRPRQGDTLLSRFRRPIARFAEDGAGGVHDFLITACDQFRYEFFGHKGHHSSCSENLILAMRRLGHEITVVPQPINFFTNSAVGPDGRLTSPPNTVPPGGYVEVEALIDLICVVSSCPFDLPREGWAVNAPGGPTELTVEVR